jgi:hypothetical protein
MNHRLIRNHIKLWRKEAGDVLEVRTLTLYEENVWEGAHLICSSQDEDRFTSSMVMDALGEEPSRQWFDSRIQELVKDGFTIIETHADDPKE